MSECEGKDCTTPPGALLRNDGGRWLCPACRARASAHATVVELVQADLDERAQVGLERYGRPIDVFGDSRDWLVEAYEEALDLCVYLRAAIERRKLAPELEPRPSPARHRLEVEFEAEAELETCEHTPSAVCRKCIGRRS